MRGTPATPPHHDLAPVPPTQLQQTQRLSLSRTPREVEASVRSPVQWEGRKHYDGREADMKGLAAIKYSPMRTGCKNFCKS